MGVIAKMLRYDFATWWSRTGTDHRGKPTYAAAVEVKCRWEDVHEQFIEESGEESVSNAKIYVDRDMQPGDLLWHGPIEDSPALPTQSRDVYEVKKFEKLPNFKNTEALRTAMV